MGSPPADSAHEKPRPDYRGLFVLAMALLVWVGLYFTGSDLASVRVTANLIGALVISLIIWQACDPFADAAQWVGKRLSLPGSVRGATLDAMASSMPELFTGIFFVVVALSGDAVGEERLERSIEGYGSTIATCAGSSIYNMILIPAICAIAISVARPQKPFIEVEPEVLKRDASWAIGAQFGLLVFLFLPRLYWWMALVAMFAYAIYIVHLYRDARRFQVYARALGRDKEENEEDDRVSCCFNLIEVRLNGVSSSIVLIATTTVAAVACYFLVELVRDTAAQLAVDTFFVAVILAAAVSSIPDTFMSLGSAFRGDDSGAVSNAFGSNIFDICICMSIPLAVSCYLNDWQPLPLADEEGNPLRGVIGLRVLLFLLTLNTMYLIWRRRRVTRKIGFVLCGMYVIFVGYAVVGSLRLINV